MHSVVVGILQGILSFLISVGVILWWVEYWLSDEDKRDTGPWAYTATTCLLLALCGMFWWMWFGWFSVIGCYVLTGSTMAFILRFPPKSTIMFVCLWPIFICDHRVWVGSKEK